MSHENEPSGPRRRSDATGRDRRRGEMARETGRDRRRGDAAYESGAGE